MIVRECELYHTGRKGMKWYQHIFTSRYYNKDGTLTAAGKKRAEKYRDKLVDRTRKDSDRTYLMSRDNTYSQSTRSASFNNADLVD